MLKTGILCFYAATSGGRSRSGFCGTGWSAGKLLGEFEGFVLEGAEGSVLGACMDECILHIFGEIYPFVPADEVPSAPTVLVFGHPGEAIFPVSVQTEYAL